LHFLFLAHHRYWNCLAFLTMPYTKWIVFINCQFVISNEKFTFCKLKMSIGRSSLSV
jgi:hypothetical protein